MTFTVAQTKEVMDRMRRMETRMTRFLELQGFDTKVKRPVWEAGYVQVPSMACSLHDMLGAVPPEWPVDALVTVKHQDAVVLEFLLPDVL